MEDITFILKAKNEARRAAKQFNDDMRKAGASTKQVATEAKKAAKETRRIGDDAKKSAGSMGLLTKSAKGLAVALAAVGGAVAIGRLLGEGITAAREFNAALAETSTLIEGTPQQIGELRSSVSDLVQAYGGTAANQVSAFYQAISAGAGSIAEANTIVAQANQLAIGGVTDVTTGVDILTTAVNAYGADTITAQQASDSLFVAMRAGKTTVGELASSLGRAIPLANASGVSFDELNAAVATLTTRGISTAEAVTGIRGVLTAVVKPTAEAQKAAKELGIDFSVAAIEANGFQAFLQDVIEATGGSAENLSKLFTGVEGLTPVLALATGGSETFAAIMDDMAVKAGATAEAFDKVNESLSQRLNRATSSIRDNFRKIGDVLLTILVPAIEFVANAFDTLIGVFEFVGNTVSTFGQIIGGIWAEIAPSFQPVVDLWSSGVDFIAEKFGGLSEPIKSIFDFLRELAIDAASAVVDTIVGMIRAIEAALSNLPAVFEAAFLAALNAAISIVERGVNAVLSLIRGLFSGLDSLTGGNLAGSIGSVSLEGLKITPSQEAQEIPGLIADAFNSGAGTLRGVLNDAQVATDAAAEDLLFAQQVIAPAAAITGTGTGVTPTLSGTSGSSGSSGSSGGSAREQTSALAEAVASLTDKYTELQETIGLTERELEEYEIRKQLVAAAEKDGVEVTEETIQSILRMRDAYEEALASADNFAAGARQGMEDFANSVQTSMEFARDFTNNAFQGLADTIAEFVRTGKLNWQDLLADLLGQIAQFLANQLVIDFLGLAGGTQGGTSGFLSGLFGGLFGGGLAEGGRVSAGKTYLVGEEGPELFRSNRSGFIMPNDETVEALGGVRGGPQITFNIMTPDADSFRRSRGQIEAQMAIALERSAERNN